MIKDFLELGQIVSTHGIRGEIRLNPWCDAPEFAKKFKTLYFDANGDTPVSVKMARPHGNIVIMKLESVDSVEKAAALKNKILYFKRSDAHLEKGKWFVSELIGCGVYDAENKDLFYGELFDVAPTGANDVWYIKTPENEEVLIPAIKDVVIDCDVENGKIFIKPLRGLFKDED